MPKGVELTTDVEFDLCSRGRDTNELHIDLIDLIEDTKIIYANKNSLLKTNVLLDNGGIKDLVSYDSIKRKLQIRFGMAKRPKTASEKLRTGVSLLTAPTKTKATKIIL